MAPEVALYKPYNETADVFSFSILLWQMSALETPYEGFSVNLFTKKVIEGGVRPTVQDKWGPSICTMLRGAFSSTPKRPSMSEVCETLRDEINKLSDEDIVDILDASRKSQLSA